MKMSDGERLIAVMLAEVMEALKLDKEIDPKLVKSLVCGNDMWAIKRRYSGIFGSEAPSDEVVSETTNILWMWGIIEHGVSKLTGDKRDQAKKWRWTRFRGFDGNNDPHYGVALTMVRDLDEFQDFKKREFNSHSMAELPHYREMYAKFEKYVDAGQAAPLSFDALRDLCE